MICPHCLKTIDDDAPFCPHCHAYAAGGGGAEFLFCEGCGARLMPSDRSCPKCGRPAPGILSTDSAAADLAAGKTASFPRLTQQLIDAELPELRHDAVSAAQVVDDSMDPFSTNVLSAEAINRAAGAPAAPASGEDPYHEPERRSRKPLIVGLALAALIAGGAYLAIADPLGMMPGFRRQLEEAAGDMFPSRQQGTGSALDAEALAEQEAAKVKEEAEGSVLTDDQAYQRLSAAYKRIVDQHDALGAIIDDYNAGYIATDIDMRNDCSASAYGARGVIDEVVGELEAMKLPEGSAYGQDVQNLLQLAAWVRQRIDMYCASWDVSLSFTGDETPAEHQGEILAPLRDRAAEDAEARDSFFAHVGEWEPAKR